ncbi:Gfo/Idh/MocA family protein [Photorhabdus aegyptia]|uniref:Putative dehydrogenase n=1 Tax=Photorhabdus aegyptia TaxID=2805098 RepID=A0A022PDH0_9GAMM|nr:Gfo/Idh/MocA family oxidoreductase [Photorhabdus aegyptia]EYU14227.1 putative dehydrogenase [Photorhabdus aegyptia]KGM27561.1 oxidoreductase [Photorhabdus luminescens]
MNRVAVIGLGNISVRHRRNLKSLFPQAEILAVSASGKMPESQVNDADSILLSTAELARSDVDLVVVASPAPFHAKHALPLIEAGIPTLIEKPVTVTMTDCEALISAIDSTSTPVAVGYCLRYLPSARKVKSLLEQELVGTIYNVFIQAGQYLPSWRPKDYRDTVSAKVELGGGALLELSHEIDYAQWLLGNLSPCHAILRSSEELNLQVEDMVDITAISANKTICHIHLDFLQRSAYRICRLIGSQGTLEWNLIKNSIEFTNQDGLKVLYDNPTWDKNQMYLDMLKDFIAMIDGKENQCVDLRTAIKTIEFITTARHLVG